jgi:hypothetical protein
MIGVEIPNDQLNDRITIGIWCVAVALTAPSTRVADDQILDNIFFLVLTFVCFVIIK